MKDSALQLLKQLVLQDHERCIKEAYLMRAQILRIQVRSAPPHVPWTKMIHPGATDEPDK